MDTKFHPTLYNGCNYLSMLGFKLIHVSKRGHRVSQILGGERLLNKQYLVSGSLNLWFKMNGCGKKYPNNGHNYHDVTHGCKQTPLSVNKILNRIEIWWSYILNEFWQQLDICDWRIQKPADTDTIQTIFVQTAIYWYTHSLTEYTSRSYAAIISKYSLLGM